MVGYLASVGYKAKDVNGLATKGTENQRLFLFDIFIYNPLHVARRAIAAVGFSN